ncbi:hypothetical protein BVC93_10890 [Mycobacterium sp. MS1601]|uniref:hypothetical protein n=1 Tax=Mycobacterium sp. MS1601 TaxID=1936029 RepID=UPI0009797324|nr:hypothetical protein [Mycobacterium sp. MS1601]AQA02852.1 hypothetical protein BVC93_10890 [Mycobacterium sp. MS1601]
MKAFAVAVAAVAVVLSGCTNTVEGVVAQTTEPVAVDGMTCEDFTALSDRDRRAVIDEILADKTVDQPVFVAGLAQVICQAIPEADLKDVLLGFAGR